MPNSAVIILVGHTGRDPELKYTSSGLAISETSLAVKTGWGSKEVTTWYELTVFGNDAERFNDWISKGDPIQIIGTPYLDVYQGKDNTTYKTLKVTVKEFTPLKQRPNNAPPAQNDPMPF